MTRPNTLGPTVARSALGLAFTVFGLNGFLNFLPQPPMSGPPAEFIGALAASGYLFPLLKGTEVVAGLALLSNRFVPLALAVLAPVLVNIVAFHAFLAGGVGLGVALTALELYLAYAYRDAFAPMLHAVTAPTSRASRPAFTAAPAE